MKIGFNGKSLFRKRTTGVERSALNFLRALTAAGSGDDWTIFARSGGDTIPEIARGGVSLVEEGALSWKINRNIWEQFALPNAARRAGIDVLINPANTAPLGYDRNVLFLYDISFLANRDWHSPIFGEYYAFLIPRLLKSAIGIVVPSVSTKNEILNRFSIDERRICVVPLGVEEIFCPCESAGQRNPYILFVGSLEPRKNLRRLIEAFVLMKRRYRTDAKLVIAGASGANFPRISFDLQGNEKNVLFRGHVDNNELVDLYRGASLFVYPSLYEGFGLPVLEAMACGCPVITSSCSSLPEVAGDAACLVDPYSIEDIAAAMERALSDDACRGSLRAKGLARSATFSWGASALSVMKFISSLRS